MIFAGKCGISRRFFNVFIDLICKVRNVFLKVKEPCKMPF